MGHPIYLYVSVEDVMKIDQMRTQALKIGINDGSENVVDRLLNFGIELPDDKGSFYITINGASICMMDCALAGQPLDHLRCVYDSLIEAIQSRHKVKNTFPGAIVSIRAGNCPRACSATQAA